MSEDLYSLREMRRKTKKIPITV